MPDTITVSKDDRGVATLTLNRPEKHNAMSAQMMAELTQVAAELGGEGGIQ